MKHFDQALPIWPKDSALEQNFQAGWRVNFSINGTESVVLSITGATLFRVSLNGQFLHHGPARGPKGYYRVDVLDITEHLSSGQGVIDIEVVGYNCNSYIYMNQPSFLQAELLVAEQVVAATGISGFSSLAIEQRIQRVERYGFQRPYVEAYRDSKVVAPAAVVVEKKNLLPRRVSIPNYNMARPLAKVSEGPLVIRDVKVDRLPFWWSTDENYDHLKAYRPHDFEVDLLEIFQSLRSAPHGQSSPHRYEMWDFGINLTGFVHCELFCSEPIRLLIAFDEILSTGDIDFARNDCLSMVYYELQPGHHRLESIEPYTGRFYKAIILDGHADIECLAIREFTNPDAVLTHFNSDDKPLNQIYEAGRITFQQNALDIYMDCPGRERAGWLCDSFFTARAEHLLCGASIVERNFIENFIIPEQFDNLPVGMLPMCYPAEHSNGCFIPQWSLWFVLELDDYLLRTGDRALVEQCRSRIEALFTFFQAYENADGLLEKLPSWNFIEWSKANDLVLDINYPSNMLYAKALEVAGKCYDVPSWHDQAITLHETIRVQSFNDTFFVDNSVYDDSGEAKLSGECSEVCQYYAFFMGTATKERYPQLWDHLMNKSGPQYRESNPLHPANAFIGTLLRMELMSLDGRVEQLVDEMKAFYSPMVEKTGTLWEHLDVSASCNHGFASYLCVILDRHKAELCRHQHKNSHLNTTSQSK